MLIGWYSYPTLLRSVFGADRFDRLLSNPRLRRSSILCAHNQNIYIALRYLSENMPSNAWLLYLSYRRRTRASSCLSIYPATFACWHRRDALTVSRARCANRPTVSPHVVSVVGAVATTEQWGTKAPSRQVFFAVLGCRPRPSVRIDQFCSLRVQTSEFFTGCSR